MSAKNKLDQYFTKPEVARYYSEKIKELLGEDNNFIEPSAGEGAFSFNFKGIQSYDLAPRFNGCHKQDFLSKDFLPELGAVFVGNPPFGKNSSLALKFLNKCCESEAMAVCFILPKTFKKRFFQERVNLSYSVLYEEDVPKNSFLLDGDPYDVPCVFQIWRPCKREQFDIENIWFEEVPKSEAEFCVRRVGGKAGTILEGLNHSESSTYFLKELCHGVKEKIKSLEGVLKEESQNTAGVRSISKKEICYFLQNV